MRKRVILERQDYLCERPDGYVLWYWVKGEDDTADFVHIPGACIMVTEQALHHPQFQTIMANNCG